MSDSPLKVAILGATSTIAEACARGWAARGAALFLAGRRAEALTAIARDLEVRGAQGEVAVWAGDLAAPEQHAALLTALEAGLGAPPDVALLAWGTLTDQARAEAEPAYAAAELEANLVAPAALLLALAGRVRQGAVLACITSVAGDRGRQSNLVYGSAKGGLQRLLEGLRHRLHGRGVAVLDIRPGFVRTRMTEHLPREGPLWAAPERVAADILAAVERRQAVLYTPWFWRWIMLAVRALPRPLFHRTRL